MSVSLTNSKDVVSNTISAFEKDNVVNVKDLFSSNLDAVSNIVGLPVETLNSLQTIAEAINSDPNFFRNIMTKLNFKSDLTYVNTQLDDIIKKFLKYDTIEVSNIKLNLKSNIIYVDSTCQAINNKFQLYGTIV